MAHKDRCLIAKKKEKNIGKTASSVHTIETKEFKKLGSGLNIELYWLKIKSRSRLKILTASEEGIFINVVFKQ